MLAFQVRFQEFFNGGLARINTVQ